MVVLTMIVAIDDDGGGAVNLGRLQAVVLGLIGSCDLFVVLCGRCCYHSVVMVVLQKWWWRWWWFLAVTLILWWLWSIFGWW